VALLSLCTEAVLRLMGIRGGPSRAVTEEEIAASLEEGVDAGVIEAQEHQMVRNVFRLDDRQIGSMMIPRAKSSGWTKATRWRSLLKCIADSGHTRFPGVPRLAGRRARPAECRFAAAAAGARRRPARAEHLEPAVFVPETCRAWNCWRTSALPTPTWSSSSTNTARCRA
jgi:putative hemolysin